MKTISIKTIKREHVRHDNFPKQRCGTTPATTTFIQHSHARTWLTCDATFELQTAKLTIFKGEKS